MNSEPSDYDLPIKIEGFLAALSKIYEREGERKLQEIVVNAESHVNEGWTSDNWNGGTYGHALSLMIPENLFFLVIKEKEKIQNRIRDDLNNLHNNQNESFVEVFIELKMVIIPSRQVDQSKKKGGC